MKQTARIDQWIVLHGHLFGNVYGHPEFKDGDFVRTSGVLNLPTALLERGCTVETTNTLYLLGNPVGRVD